MSDPAPSEDLAAAGPGRGPAGTPVPGAPAGHVSLEGVHGTVAVPQAQAGFWRQWRAFVGPAILVSVGYMDPGNWGTDLAGGAQFKYGLLWVVAVASFAALILQVIAARLGVVTGEEGRLLREALEARREAVKVDDFPQVRQTKPKE